MTQKFYDATLGRKALAVLEAEVEASPENVFAATPETLETMEPGELLAAFEQLVRRGVGDSYPLMRQLRTEIARRLTPAPAEA
jgi:hypothetical protein